MATLKEIAKEAGVSVDTVSRVLNGQRKETWPSMAKRAEHIRQIAEKLNYRPNAAARATRNQQTKQVGVLVPNSPGENRFTHPLAYETILGINEGLGEAGYTVTLARIDDVKGDLAKQSRVFEEHVIDGMIVLDSMPADVEQRIEQLIPQTVWCDSNVWREHACLRRDERFAGRCVAQAAADLGYKRAVWYSYPEVGRIQHFSSVERYAGIREVADAHGVQITSEWETPLSNDQAMHRLHASMDRDHVVICNSIYQARKLRTIAEGFGKRPGYDFGLMCTDDARHLDRYWHGLTRVHFDRYRLGFAAAHMMLDLLDKGREACPSRLFQDGFHPGDSAWGPLTR